MNQPLKVLLVEDNAADAALLVQELRRAGFDPEWKRVDTEPAFVRQLKEDFELVLCDHSMPGFNGLRALELFCQQEREIPFIFVSGTLGEEAAVKAMKHGAADYLLKDRLAGLGPSVTRALADGRLRRERRAEAALRTAQDPMESIFDAAPVAILGLDLQGRVTRWNAGATRMFGWTEAEVLGKVSPAIPADGLADFFAILDRVTRHGPQTGLHHRRRKRTGEWLHVSLSSAPLRSPAGDIVGLMVIMEDITERVQAEEALVRSEREQRQLARQLAEEKSRLNSAQAVARVGSWETVVETGTVSWSDETHRIFETDPRTFQPTHAAFVQLVHPDDRQRVDQAFVDSLATREPCTVEHRLRMADGRIKIVEERWQVMFDEQGQPVRAVGTCQDITQRKQADAALRESEGRFRTIFEQAGIGIALVGPTDGRLLRCNRALTEMLGYDLAELHQLTVRDVSDPHDYADDRRQWERLLTGEIERFQMEKRYVRKDGRKSWGLLTSTLVRDAAGQPQYVIGMVEDIDDRKRAAAELQAAERQLHTLVERLNTVREEEAKRIARELHDELGQRLTALNMELANLEMKTPGTKPRRRTQIARMQATVDGTIEIVQKISSELRLGQLDLLGLSAAVEWQVKEFSRLSGLPCRLRRIDEIEGLTDAQSTNLFRILQEALTNIRRHAQATKVEISLTAAADQVKLTVRDDGRGITPAELADHDSIGLLGMRERAQLLGGGVTVTGAPGRGTTVCAVVPRTGRHPTAR